MQTSTNGERRLRHYPRDFLRPTAESRAAPPRVTTVAPAARPAQAGHVRDRADVAAHRTGPSTARRVLLVVCGALIVVLAAGCGVMAVEGARGPTTLLGRMASAWEGVFVVATVLLTAAMLWISASLRTAAPWILAATTAATLLTASVVALARLAGAVEITFPVATWVPGIVLLSLWGWAAGRSAVRRGLLPKPLATTALVLAVLQVVVILLGVAVFALNDGRNVGLNVLAGFVVPVILGGLGAWWIGLGILWRPRRA